MDLAPERQQLIDDINEALRSTDWIGYHKKVSWSLQQPRCSLYDGKALCRYWVGWIQSGRDLYPADDCGLEEYGTELRRHDTRLTSDLVNKILQYS